MTTTEWRWVDIDGTEQVVGVDGLTRMLSSGSLPPHTLVWKTTWLGWHPASEVPELAAAAGSSAVAPRSIATSQSAVNPPPPPADRYAELQGKATTLLAERSSRSMSPPLRWNLPRPASVVPTTVRGPVAPPANLPGRSTMIGMVPHGAPPPPPPSPPQPLATRSTAIGMAPQSPTPAVPAVAGSPEPSPPETAGGAVPVPSLARTLAGLPVTPPTPSHFTPHVSEASVPTGPIRIRNVLPTLTEEEEATHSPTLRPIGALPPPPRAARKIASEPGAPSLSSAAPAVQTPLPLPSFPVAPTPEAQSQSARPDLASAEGIPDGATRRARSQSGRGLGGMSSKTFTLLTGLSFLIPGTAVLVLALLKPRTTAPVTPAESTGASAAVAPAKAALGCSIERPAQRIAGSAFLQVPLIVAPAKNGTRVAIGFATDKLDAKGILVDPATLTATDAFATRTGNPILGVVPTAVANEVTFVVDEAQPEFAFARTVDGKERFSLGVTHNGFARRAGTTDEVLWPGKSDKPAITTPRVAAAPDGGFAVAFRHGGQDGKILVGWLDENGHKKSELKAVTTDASVVGTPTIAVGPSGALVAFAAKNAAADPYGIELARVPIGGAPERSHRFTIPAGGPGTEAISPSAEALGKERFLLQWTEGSAGNRAVRVQILSVDLVPIADATTLSAPDQNAGQGALWVGMDRALALFLSKTEASHELWGAILKCP